jgi:hypothetical protein
VQHCSPAMAARLTDHMWLLWPVLGGAGIIAEHYLQPCMVWCPSTAQSPELSIWETVMQAFHIEKHGSLIH